ncbi:MAG: phytanoyl-CoA dioxygenase family protein [Flavobacteriales bacterium]|nr:phytanoyl-CoA dioxygenase family protein [Flavobacteriales bacterium]
MVTKSNFETNGFAVIPDIYTSVEVDQLRHLLDNYCTKLDHTKAVHAIRQTLEEIPELSPLLWTKKMKTLIADFAGADYFLTKAIYFDKPEESNWFVAYHQDLSINISERFEIEGYKNWTKKKGQFGVEPPLKILDNIVTIRVHLDDTDETNGALRVVPKSHKWGVKRIQDISTEEEEMCIVPKGGIMLMKPLTFHASSRSTAQKRRRVLHLEFSNMDLASPLQWREKQTIQ